MSDFSFSQQKVIVVAGSKELLNYHEEKIILAKAIGAFIIRNTQWILLTGGASSIREKEEPTAIDYWVAIGANEEAKSLSINPEERIITLHPIQSDHPLHSIGKVEISKRRTPALRRYDLVARADAIITIEGLTGLTTILELALALNKILLPIPCTGGTSKEVWDTYEDDLLKKLRISKSDADYAVLTQGLNTPILLADKSINMALQDLPWVPDAVFRIRKAKRGLWVFGANFVSTCFCPWLCTALK